MSGFVKNNDELPEGWGWTTLGKLSAKSQYGWTTKAKNKGRLHLLRTTDISSGRIDWNSVPFCEEEPEDVEKYLLKPGDIVISRAGSIGLSHLITEEKKAIFASYLIRFRIYEDNDKKYVKTICPNCRRGGRG